MGNVYSFFVVSIFWVVVINLFRGVDRASYGVISAGGSIGAFLGATVSGLLSNTFTEWGMIFYGLISASLLLMAMFVGITLLIFLQMKTLMILLEEKVLME